MHKSLKQTHTVLVHGIWMRSLVLAFFRKKLERLGLPTQSFAYSNWGGDLQHNAQQLNRFLSTIQAQKIYLVGHSLGGLLILQLLSQKHDDRIQRAVLLGTPCQGSQAAKQIAKKIPWGEKLLGPTGLALTHAYDFCPKSNVELGLIAGSKSMGLGKLLGGLAQPNDGTVAICETSLSKVENHIVLPVSHTGMVFSNEVAKKTFLFLTTGLFAKTDSSLRSE